MAKRMPASVWRGLEYTCIHSAILFADIQNSVMISSTISLAEYDRLIDQFQEVMLQLVEDLRDQGMPVGEAYVAGDQLCIFFYDPQEVKRNYQLDGPESPQGSKRRELITTCREQNQVLIFSALKAAVQLKNLWLVQHFNVERVISHHSPFELSIGIHSGRVYLRDRPDGQRRIEGYAVNLAKRIETASRQGRYSFIMFSQEACETLRRAVGGHSQLRQRLFFHRHELQMQELKGIAKPQPVFELRFCHRIQVPVDKEVVAQHDAIFAIDPTNTWSYYQLVEYHGYTRGDWDTAYELAQRAQVVNPADEKVKLDLSKYHFQRGELQMSLVYAKQALELNPEFDLAYEQLALISNALDDIEGSVEYLRNAVSLSPGSAGNHLNLGLILVEAGQFDEAMRYLQNAINIDPRYAKGVVPLEALRELSSHVKLPGELLQLIAEPQPNAKQRKAAAGGGTVSNTSADTMNNQT